ncbi:MAG TPA: DUF5074 domain-containing protein [Balneolaceae bacterium]|nr:DUF5074 domain-containing protein [Balneolaceae bacterium]
MIKKLIFGVILATFIISGCSNNSTGNKSLLPTTGSVYVTNAGNFSQSNGSITSFDAQTGKTDTVAFKLVNKRPFAGLIQSARIFGNKFYIVSNRTDKIEVTDAKTLESLATISMADSPTAFQKVSDSKAYATTLNNNTLVDSVSIINLSSNEETDQRIAVGNQPSDIVKVNSKVFVSNAGGVQPNSADSTISVINTNTDAVEDTITVGYDPVQMAVDGLNRIWVVCHGLVAYDKNYNRLPNKDEPGGIYVINPRQGKVIYSKTLKQRPSQIALDKQDSRAYLLLTDKVETINMKTFNIRNASFINRKFNVIDYSPNERMLYLAYRNGYVQRGEAVRYDLKGTAVDSFKTGYAPIGFHFVK